MNAATTAAAANLRIPVLMCHGIRTGGDAMPSAYPLSEEHFEKLVAVAHSLGFESISYDQLERWRAGDTEGLPARPIMWDVDHPVKGVLGIARVLKRHGMAGNLFVNTGVMGAEEEWGIEPYAGVRDQASIVTAERGGPAMTWEDIRGLVREGWHIGAHTVTHPNLSELSTTDPAGTILIKELEACDNTLYAELGRQPRDFAFTSTTFSTIAAELVEQRYRFGRLWIIGSHYHNDGQDVRFASISGHAHLPDEDDGGPPTASRYITRNTLSHRLPSMEIQSPLIHAPQDFRAYLLGACEQPLAAASAVRSGQPATNITNVWQQPAVSRAASTATSLSPMLTGSVSDAQWAQWREKGFVRLGVQLAPEQVRVRGHIIGHARNNM